MLRYAINIVLLCSLANAAPKFSRNSEKIHVDVYYEARCPDSRAFLIKQLGSKWSTLSTYMDVRLVPFGKATFEPKPEGGWSFDCQHGPDECSGNILHACGIKYSSNSTQALKYASCLMKTPDAGETCSEAAGLDFKAIDNCHKTLEGENLLHKNGVETLSLEPKLVFVPWIIMDKEWEDQRQWGSIINFKETSCKYIDNEAPACETP